MLPASGGQRPRTQLNTPQHTEQRDPILIPPTANNDLAQNIDSDDVDKGCYIQ